MIKTPNVAGTFYPSDKSELTKMLDKFFSNVNLPKSFSNLLKSSGNHLKSSSNLLKSSGNHLKSLKAIVAPHAGYVYSGPIAAYSYKILEEYLQLTTFNLKLGTIVIMAPSHYEYFEGISIGLYDKFQTPLGDIDVDKKLGEKLIKSHPDYFSFNQAAYAQEHALEVQLPFLQYCIQHSKSNIQNLKIIPMIFGNVNPIEIGNILAELSKKENVFFIVSSDLSHFMSYDNAVTTDNDTLQDFVNQKIDMIIKEGEACGIHPWLALTQIAHKNKRKAELIKYMNSGDVTGDKSRVVGYGSMVYHA